MFRRVTVGVDGSPESSAAAEWAAQESLLRGAPLHLVHAYAQPHTEAFGATVRRRWAEELLAEAAETLRREHPSVEVSTRLLSGRPATALADAAVESDLLVLGSRGLSGAMGFLLGSVGMETVSSTERPVVLVRVAGQAPASERTAPVAPSRDVVVGVDLKHFCAPLLRFGFEAAARRGDRLLVLHGWSIPPVVRDAGALLAAEREMSPDVARRLAEILAPWREEFPSVETEERSPVGAPAELLIRASARADLVVLGRRVRMGPLGKHIGSVAHGVIHHSTAPVAVVAHH